MKQFRFIAFVLVFLLAVALASCASESFDDDILLKGGNGISIMNAGEAGVETVEATEEASEEETEEATVLCSPEYTVEQAISDGCTVYVSNGVGNDVREEGNMKGFIAAIENGEYSSWNEAYFTKDEKILFYTHVYYDENGYHYDFVYFKDSGDEYGAYTYTGLDVFEFPNGTAKGYLFTNDEEMTFEKFMHFSALSKMPDISVAAAIAVVG